MDDLYQLPFVGLIVVVVTITVALAMGGLALARRYALRRIKYHDGANDAISGVVGAIGVFYGITVGLIAIDVWQRHSYAEGIAAREAAAIQTLYLMANTDIGTVADPVTAESPTGKLVSNYLRAVICEAWRDHRAGNNRPRADWEALRAIREAVGSIEPKTDGAKVRYAATIQCLNELSELRRLRVDAANDKLSATMWAIIIVGGVMSLFVVYLFNLRDAKLHFVVVFLSSGLLSLVLLIIVLNDRPFLGESGIKPDSYTEIAWILRDNPFRDKGWPDACGPRTTATK